MHNRIGSVLKRIDQNNLPFDIFNYSEKKVNSAIFVKMRPVRSKKIIKNLRWIFTLAQAFLCPRFEQRQQQPCLLDFIEREGQKKPVVKLIIKINKILVVFVTRYLG